MSETRVLELQQGAGEPGAIELRAGVQLPPVGVGSSGSWKVQALGILGIHAYIYYDGNALFVQSADERNPALVDGRAVGCAWTPVRVPCTISLAAARLVLRDVSATIDDEDQIPQDEDRTVAAPSARSPTLDEDRTIAAAAPAPPPPPPPSAPRSVRSAPQAFAPAPSSRRAPPASARPFAPGAFVTQPDGESTRLQPIDEPEPDGDATRVVPLAELAETPPLGSPLPRMPFRPAPVRPAAGQRWAEGRPSRPSLPDSQEELSTVPKEFPIPPPDTNDTPLLEPPAPVALLNVPPPPVPVAPKGPTFGERLAKEWRETPPIKKLLVFLMPFMLPVVWFTFGDEPPPPHRVGSAGSASAGGAQLPTATTTQPYPYPPSVASAPTGYPPAGYPTAQTDPALPPPGHTRPPVDPTAKPPATTADPSASAAPVDRREHQAADLVATGQYDQAAQIYDRLAAEHPDNPAFREASRILRAKLGGPH